MLAKAAKALILAPVDAPSAGAIVNLAKSRDVLVIGWGNLPDGPLVGYVGNDVEQLGRLQGETLLDILKKGGDPKRGKVVMLNGDAATPATKDFLKGRKPVPDPNVEIGRDSYVDNQDPSNAQRGTDQAITALGRDKIIGVYAMNDGIASVAAAAMKNAGFNSRRSPASTPTSAMQRIPVGQQRFTIDARGGDWGETAVPVVLKAARGEKLTSDRTVSNATTHDIPWFTTADPVVTKENLQERRSPAPPQGVRDLHPPIRQGGRDRRHLLLERSRRLA